MYVYIHIYIHTAVNTQSEKKEKKKKIERNEQKKRKKLCRQHIYHIIPAGHRWGPGRGTRRPARRSVGAPPSRPGGSDPCVRSRRAGRWGHTWHSRPSVCDSCMYVCICVSRRKCGTQHDTTRRAAASGRQERKGGTGRKGGRAGVSIIQQQ